MHHDSAPISGCPILAKVTCTSTSCRSEENVSLVYAAFSLVQDPLLLWRGVSRMFWISYRLYATSVLDPKKPAKPRPQLAEKKKCVKIRVPP